MCNAIKATNNQHIYFRHDSVVLHNNVVFLEFSDSSPKVPKTSSNCVEATSYDTWLLRDTIEPGSDYVVKGENPTSWVSARA